MLKLIKENPIDTLGIVLGGLLLVMLSSMMGWVMIVVAVYLVLIPWSVFYLLPVEFVNNLELFKRCGDIEFFVIATIQLTGEVIVLLYFAALVGLA